MFHIGVLVYGADRVGMWIVPESSILTISFLQNEEIEKVFGNTSASGTFSSFHLQLTKCTCTMFQLFPHLRSTWQANYPPQSCKSNPVCLSTKLSSQHLYELNPFGLFDNLYIYYCYILDFVLDDLFFFFFLVLDYLYYDVCSYDLSISSPFHVVIVHARTLVCFVPTNLHPFLIAYSTFYHHFIFNVPFTPIPYHIQFVYCTTTVVIFTT